MSIMRIIIDARQLRTSSGRYVERLLHYLQQVDSVNDYQILLAPKDFAGWKATNSRFTKVECPYKEFTISEQLGMNQQITNMHADLVHFPFAQQPIMYRGKVITTIQDLTTLRFRNPTKQLLVFKVKQQIYKWLNRRVARKSVALITPTEFVKKDVAAFAGVPESKITVTLESADQIPNSPTPLNIQNQNLQKSKFIMYVGRPTPHKNLLRLLRAHSLLQQSHPGLLLILAGKKDAMYDLVEQQARKEGLLKGVIFTGFVSESELKWLYQNCSAYVFPSLSEGFGLPGLEAMLHGAPVVSSNATCLPEVHGNAAHYFNPLDVGDMAAKIGEVLDSPTLRKKLIAKGHEQVKKFSWKRMAEQTLVVYSKALERV